MPPKVSIIIPVFNGEKYIECTIRSVLSQSFEDWELLIINDGSEDRTESIIKKYSYNNKIKYYYKNNSGVSETRNYGIELSAGDYIAFLDADDIWETNNLKSKIEILEKNQQIDWVYSDMYNADEFMNRIGIAQSGTDKEVLNNLLEWKKEVVPGPCSNIVVRRKCLQKGIRFDSKFSTAADQDFCIQLASKFKSVHIPTPLWSYRIISTSMSRNIDNMEKDHIGVFKKAEKLNLFKSFLQKQRCFSNLYLIIAGSWWNNGNRKLRALQFLMLAFILYPPSLLQAFWKLYRKITYY